MIEFKTSVKPCNTVHAMDMREGQTGIVVVDGFTSPIERVFDGAPVECVGDSQLRLLADHRCYKRGALLRGYRVRLCDFTLTEK